MLAQHCQQRALVRVITRRKISPHAANARSLLTLAIETSCDDTSVAIVEKHGQNPGVVEDGPAARLYFHEKITSDNSKFGGVHPIVAQDSHQRNLATLVARAISSLPLIPISQNGEFKEEERGVYAAHENCRAAAISSSTDGIRTLRQKPDFISVTRGPGIRSCLATGLDTAKGLAVGWQIPLIGINHMQAHALTPRLVSALTHGASREAKPTFPFLSLLVSGGHTLLVHSKSISDHAMLADTHDIAIGDCLDKIARTVLPPNLLNNSKDVMYGRLLESFAFPSELESYDYTPPGRRHEELARIPTRWGWSLGAPLSETRAGKSRSMEFTFSGTQGNVERIYETRNLAEDGREDEKADLAKEAMRVLFEHLSSRVVMALQRFRALEIGIGCLVISGGVASNRFLKHVLRRFLDARGFSHVQILSPPAYLCTDNAAMIGWTGLEMYEAGWASDLSIQARRKWSIDADAEDGGILNVDGWKRRKRSEAV